MNGIITAELRGVVNAMFLKVYISGATVRND